MNNKNLTSGLTHLDDSGQARMVDVGDKAVTRRLAIAKGTICLSDVAMTALNNHTCEKGDVLATARIAAITACKRTSEWIPLCHCLPLDSVIVDFDTDSNHQVHCQVTVTTHAKTGVEMEALVGVQAGLLTIYDMLKAIDRTMVISDIRLVEKQGGRSGHFQAP